MKLRACIWNSEPWVIDDGPDRDWMLETAISEAAYATASGAGSDLLESPEQWCRDLLKDQITEAMKRSLREPGDRYKAPDGVAYILEED